MHSNILNVSEMAGKRKINSEVDSESKKSKNEEWDIYQTEAFLHFYVLLSCTTADCISQSRQNHW